jgi:hypothetical protein
VNLGWAPLGTARVRVRSGEPSVREGHAGMEG